MTTREICKICYEINRVGFWVPDDQWVCAIPQKFTKEIVCLSCFTKLADEKLIRWDKSIAFFPVSFKTHLEK